MPPWASFDAEACGTAGAAGDTGSGGVGVEDLVAFLDAAAEQHPALPAMDGAVIHTPFIIFHS